ncbi:MAG: transporter substrate-binding domain-containing protein [Treponema sp.]|jgi:polar amino acid transport system substrate-binding protein|nr:transporter substrate-binding domain-containing protein [Treponema sp.]
MKICTRLFFLITAALVLTGCRDSNQGQRSNLLETVRDTKILRVGTSSDSAPWSFKDEQDNFVGYDMDLIREIAKRMGTEVQITDMSFDALVAAVQTGKVDVAICSMGAKEERKKLVDFSQMYHQQLNVYVAQQDSAITINNVEDIVGYTVGVQSGTLPEQYITELVDAGKMKDSQVSHYEKAEPLYLDLVSGRIQLIAGDIGQTREFMKLQPIKIVYETSFYGTGENIAVPKNQPEFLAEIDRILDELRTEGFLASLDAKWDV